MGRAVQAVSRLVRSQITAICVVVFIADLVSGILSPTFSLFVEQLGISLVLLGVINTVGGLASLTTSFPIGSLSDRISRPWIIRAGLLCFALATAMYALAGSSVPLVAGRIILALGMVSVFRISAAHLADVVPRERRGLAFGAYATALGSGVTVGAFVGGFLADRFSIVTAYWVASGLALGGFCFALRFLRAPQRVRPAVGARNLRRDFGELIFNRPLLQAGIASILTSFVYTGAVTTFFPLRGEDLGLTRAEIGTIFAVRGVVSTLGRVPNGIIARYVGDKAIILATLGIDLIVMLGLWQLTDTIWLFALLALEGLAFGGFVVASQMFITNHASDDLRGSAIGLNATASGLGATLAPLALGVLAGQFRLVMVFPATALLLALGLLGILLIRDEVEAPALKSQTEVS
jgi:MFS family permease